MFSGMIRVLLQCVVGTEQFPSAKVCYRHHCCVVENRAVLDDRHQTRRLSPYLGRCSATFVEYFVHVWTIRYLWLKYPTIKSLRRAQAAKKTPWSIEFGVNLLVPDVVRAQ